MASGHWAEAVELSISLLFPHAFAYLFHVELVVSEHSQHGQWYSPLFDHVKPARLGSVDGETIYCLQARRCPSEGPHRIVPWE
jgi:hypothetical protein